ncbi:MULTISPECIES: PAS domain-containing protein [unclassified Coleofasciculus]|uniref:PAS domain-containing protein n=1 Tax=unclassified Coleofasciculus TaxID=2692782 RepID=UPI00187ECAF7|nr:MULTISPECIES: PAS domain-containing protein [unclassified Coleofasciculus]MBE9127546.1 PAS domain-containing protein [Coleofasciculus sp. LEGE 07081]MBE9150869.1 PAS domain-containing protein [Coleofasciculus sp. LEGE 07092]
MKFDLDLGRFAQQVEVLQERLEKLYHEPISQSQLPSESMPLILRELGTASEELQVAMEELFVQAQELTSLRSKLEAEHCRYQNLFEFFPTAYLVTDTRGIIQEANQAAATLLNISHQFLEGKPFNIFTSTAERQKFPAKLTQLKQSRNAQESIVQIQPRQSQPCEVAVTVSPVCNSDGKLTNLHWILHPINEHQQIAQVLNPPTCKLSEGRPRYFYTKGETISLNSKVVWLVCQGLVKLTTVSEEGDEVLMGLAGQSMPFGSSMTCLQIYQATALSKEVELVSISLAEISTSLPLSQALLQRMKLRLQQTESLLALAGKRRVQDRFYHFLLWLKQEFGQPVPQGTRLMIRLTHQDLAEACCTTRVTVTRLMGKLHKQGKIAFDSERHIIFRE